MTHPPLILSPEQKAFAAKCRLQRIAATATTMEEAMQHTLSGQGRTFKDLSPEERRKIRIVEAVFSQRKITKDSSP
ncbi:MAG: hypothetical protein ABIP97_11385 [Chthoniobacterales bacterium]